LTTAILLLAGLSLLLKPTPAPKIFPSEEFLFNYSKFFYIEGYAQGVASAKKALVGEGEVSPEDCERSFELLFEEVTKSLQEEEAPRREQ